VAPGDPVTFTVVAEGTGTLLYQWAKDGVDIADATDSTLSIESAELTDAGSYTVVVTDDVGSTTSEPATLTVTDEEPDGPTITTQPQSQTVAPGAPVTFTVVAEGTGTLLYQWAKDGVDIADATGLHLVDRIGRTD
jgi:hypothetical protein